MRKISAVFSLLTLAAAAHASGADFCAVQPDGKTVKVSVMNRYKTATYCQVHCEFATSSGGTYVAECGETVPPGVETALCSKVSDNGPLGALKSGSVSCFKPFGEPSQDDD